MKTLRWRFCISFSSAQVCMYAVRVTEQKGTQKLHVSNDAPTEKRNLLECFLLQNIYTPLQLAYTCWLHC